MIFYFSSQGTLINNAPSNVYQGSNKANEVYFVCPTASTNAVTVRFALPNGYSTKLGLMTHTSTLTGVTDSEDNTFNVWRYEIPQSVTRFAGTCTAQFQVVTAVNNAAATTNQDVDELWTQPVNFTIQKGVAPTLPETPTETIYNQILTLLAYIQTNKVDKETDKGLSTIKDVTKNQVGDTLTFTKQDGTTFTFSGGEPAVYIKSAEVSGQTLTLTKKDYSTVTFTPTDNNYTTADKTKLSNIEEGAEVNDVTDVTINNVSIVENKVAKIIYETGLGSESNNSATVTAIRNYVNSSIEAIASYYITSNASGNAFATKSALDTGSYYYAGSLVDSSNPYHKQLTRNDYVVVIADETHNNMSARYLYTNNQWAFQYTFNMQFTQAQIDALNSGITSTKVDAYDTHLSSTDNPHSVTKTQVGLGNVTNVAIPTPTTSDVNKGIKVNASGEYVLGVAEVELVSQDFFNALY